MNRDDILRYAGEQLGAGPEYLWAKSPTYFVLRHGNNRKWFAVVMDVPWAALGLSGGRTFSMVSATRFSPAPCWSGRGFFPPTT